MVSDKYFAKEIEKRIGVQTDTTAIDKELANYESKLKEVDLNKARLEREIDNLPVDTRFRERKIHDMTLRLDALYDTIVELEERIEDAKLRKSSIEMETITLDNIYKLMLNFGKLYDIISDEEKKSLITYLIKEIQIYPNGESEQPLKSIEFNFPIYRDGQEVRRLLWEKGNTVERRVYLQKHKKVSEYDSENLMYSLIEDIISANKYSSLDVVCHFPLNMLIKNPELLNEQECQYAMNPATHLDFLIYNRIGKKPVLAIEVDGYEYHKEDTVQASRDLLKNHIMELYEIPLLRFMTNGSGEKEKIIEMLDKLVR